MEDRRIRLNVLPNVCPNPRSSGSKVMRARVELISSTSIRLGVSNSVADCDIGHFLRVRGSLENESSSSKKLLRVKLHDEILIDFCR